MVEIGDDDLTVATCVDTFPDLWFMFNSKWLQVEAKDYVIRDSDRFCIINIRPIDMPFNVFGMPLLAGYYSTFDPRQGTMTVGPNVGSTKSDIISGTIITDVVNSNLLDVDGGSTP